jgi:nucleotidyltransferase substrate binding protein (TIGR01987 family)
MVKALTYQFRLKALVLALESFGKSLEIDLSSRDETEADAIKNGQALKFGYSMELFWKVLKSFMYEVHGIECNSPKSCIKSFFQNSPLSEDDYQRLIEMVNHRNELAHIYDELTFEMIWKALPSNLEIMLRCLQLFDDTAITPKQ